MSRFSYTTGPAGLDSVIFHYDNSNERTDCNISCFLMSTLDCHSSLPPQAVPKRAILASCDTNTTSSTRPQGTRREIRSRPYPKKRPENLQLTRQKSRTPHVTTSPLSPSPPALSLPPIPSVPSLILPSFSDLETSPIPSPTSQDHAEHAPYHDIPSLFHHNSPYVPWPSPLRRQFIRPSSATSSKYPQSYSRSGAVAPEPMSYEERDHRTVGQKIKNIQRSLRHGIKSAALHLRFKKRRKACSTGATTKQGHGPCVPSPPAQNRLSVATCDTAMTNSLELWLADRCRASLDCDTDQTGMTLDEYERTGSWIQHEAPALAPPSRVARSPVSVADSYLSGLSLRTTESDVDVYFPPTPDVTGLHYWQPGSGASSMISMMDAVERKPGSTGRSRQRVRSPLASTFA